MWHYNRNGNGIEHTHNVCVYMYTILLVNSLSNTALYLVIMALLLLIIIFMRLYLSCSVVCNSYQWVEVHKSTVLLAFAPHVPYLLVWDRPGVVAAFIVYTTADPHSMGSGGGSQLMCHLAHLYNSTCHPTLQQHRGDTFLMATNWWSYCVGAKIWIQRKNCLDVACLYSNPSGGNFVHTGSMVANTTPTEIVLLLCYYIAAVTTYVYYVMSIIICMHTVKMSVNTILYFNTGLLLCVTYMSVKRYVHWRLSSDLNVICLAVYSSHLLSVFVAHFPPISVSDNSNVISSQGEILTWLPLFGSLLYNSTHLTMQCQLRGVRCGFVCFF